MKKKNWERIWYSLKVLNHYKTFKSVMIMKKKNDWKNEKNGGWNEKVNKKNKRKNLRHREI